MSYASHRSLLPILGEIVGKKNVLTQPIDTMPYTTDWRGRYHGQALAVVRPANTAEVAAVVRACLAAGVSLVPQGGNTSLCGGATPDASGQQIVLSLQRLQQIRLVDAANRTLTAEAGCTLLSVQKTAARTGLLFPLSLASEGTCTIGGNLSTNAGGTAVLRYGNARSLCLGLEVVTAQGEIWDGLRGLRKDNTGYDLRDLFIGAEGTLGVITAAVLQLYPQPRATCTALVAVADPNAALQLLQACETDWGASLTAFECFSQACLRLVTRHFPTCRDPFPHPYPWYVLVEINSHEDASTARAKQESSLTQALQAGCAQDVVIAESASQQQALWALRENISAAQAKAGPNIKHDIAVPLSKIEPFMAQTQAALERTFPGIELIVFGHFGDGNLHYNVGGTANLDGPALLTQQPLINRIVHDTVHAYGGSISAEHGLGQLKREEIQRYKSPIELALQRQIKESLDPSGIMNPGKVL